MSQKESKQLFWSDSRYKLKCVDAGKFYASTDFCPDNTYTFEAKNEFSESHVMALL